MSVFKIRIGNVCHFPPPPGGMPVQAEALADGLRSEGITVRAIPTNLGGNALLRMIDSTRFLRSFVRFPVFLIRLLLALPLVDILHVHCCSGLSFFLFATPSLLMGKVFGRRSVLHYHGGNAEAFFRRYRRILPWIIRQADTIIVPSEYLRKVFADFGFDTVVIRNICPVQRFETSRQGELQPRFIVARNLEPVYNVSCILRAFAIVHQQYQDARLCVLGGGAEEAQLKKLTSELGLADSVNFVGYVENSKTPELFRSASVFLNSSISDNQPVSILEAYAAGLPVITSRAGGIPILVEHEKTGLLFDIDDHQGMADNIFRLMNDSNLARTLITNARSVVQQHSWPSVFTHLKSAYESVLDDARSRSFAAGHLRQD